MKNELNERLYDEIRVLPVIDTHEHLIWDEEIWHSDGKDVLSEYLTHYMKSDVLSAGLAPDKLSAVLDSKGDIAGRWRLIEPYWEASRYTGYGRALDISAKGIYGLDGVSGRTIEALNEAFLKNKKPGHIEHVLRDLCGIESCLTDVWTFHVDNKLPMLKPIWQPMNFIMPAEPFGKDILEHISEKHSITVACLDDWIEALECELELITHLYNAKTIKSSIAYWRPLRFEATGYARASALFEEALNNWERERSGDGALLRFPRELQDFMMRRVMEIAGRRHLTVQFHTGLFEGSGNTLSNGNPELLTSLFIDYPDVDFDLFHIGYPYQSVACALAKMFPNVTVDMCWAHIISPSASICALHDFLDAIPYNKISAFGGDYLFVDGVYGHLEIARRNVARVLAEKAENGIFGEDKALEIARALFYDNPKRIFKLEC
jgi:predicted TIM-barrel fold metal-dependent hydrolase